MIELTWTVIIALIAFSVSCAVLCVLKILSLVSAVKIYRRKKRENAIAEEQKEYILNIEQNGQTLSVKTDNPHTTVKEYEEV